jgi:hypothetical protein
MNIKEQYRNKANNFLKEDEELFSQERVEKITQEAIDAFWAKVAELVPEAQSGDLDPITVNRFEGAANSAVRAWINYNATDEPVM